MSIDWIQSIHHDGSPSYLQLHGSGLSARATIRLRLDRSAPVEAIFLRICPDGEQAIVAMQPESDDAVCRWWRGELPVRMVRTGYRFLLHTDVGNRWYNAAGLVDHYPTDANDFKLLATFKAPTWLRDSVFYQIFPDRFADGDPANNVRSGEYVYGTRPVVARPWGERPDRANGAGEFFGGDLQGITQQLDYLEDLGVNAIYLNPIFLAPSNHKYDVADYEQVDPHLGGDAALAELRSALTARGMHLLLDIVPNHCGATHPWFLAAQADPEAPTAEFFTFNQHPDQYESWLGVPTLPKLNYRSERLRDMMYAGSTAIMRRWLRPPFAIDGWRIDVANMLGRQGPHNLGHKIGRGIRRALKAEQPEAYLLGEHFFDGTPHLQGDELDASMNYQGFTFPVWRWLSASGARSNPLDEERPITTEQLVAQWRAFRAAIPWQIVMQQFNLLGSHDTSRLITILGGNRDLVRVATALLFTYPGIPCVYYGDELGLHGEGDPGARCCMPWDESTWDHELRSWFQQLIQLRRTAPALRWGGFQLLYAAGDSVAYQREAPEERLIIVVRRADDGLRDLPVRHGGLADGMQLHELLTGVRAQVVGGQLPLQMPPAPGVQIWRCTSA